MMDSSEFQRFTLDNGLQLQKSNKDSPAFLSNPDLNGYFEMEKSLGKIQITGFKFSIKALNQDKESAVCFDLDKWSSILWLITSSSIEDPLQMMLVNSHFLHSKKHHVSKTWLLNMLAKLPENDKPNLNSLQTLKTSKIIKLTPKSRNTQVEDDGTRYLVELVMPKVKLNFKHHNVEKDIPFTDLNHLVLTSFKQWKQFVIWTYFRLELNITAQIP